MSLESEFRKVYPLKVDNPERRLYRLEKMMNGSYSAGEKKLMGGEIKRLYKLLKLGLA